MNQQSFNDVMKDAATFLMLLMLSLSVLGSSPAQDPFDFNTFVGRVGDTIRVTIEVENVSFEAFEIGLVTDSTVARPVGFRKIGYPIESWTSVENIKSADTIFVAAASVAQVHITDPTVIFAIDYAMIGEGTIPIEVTKFRLNETLYNLPDSFIESRVELVWGDADGTGEIDNEDALLMLRHSAFSEFITGSQQPIADVTGDGTISPLDAALVMQWTVNLRDCFPVEVGCE